MASVNVPPVSIQIFQGRRSGAARTAIVSFGVPGGRLVRMTVILYDEGQRPVDNRSAGENGMSKPEIAGTKPVVMVLDPEETYWWCACGRSKNQPFCDGSHAGTEWTPLEVRVEHRKNHALCTCKRTCGAPWCDGTHSKL